jgi:hypothetical protein
VGTQVRICIVGAGAGGLSAAYYLQQRGYRHVTVLERAERIGGLCDSFTFDNRGFDLGGNYVLPSYRHMRRMARELGAQLTTGPDRRTWDHTMNGNQGGFRSTLSSVLQGTTLLRFALACLKYVFLLFRFRRALRRPGFAGISQHPELCQPFSQFLAENGLEAMRRLFLIPISIMGYGRPGVKGELNKEDPEYLQQIAAAYVLKYIDFGVFVVLLLVGAGLSNTWPKRFVDGYERFWERVCWRLDVRRGVDIEEVRRGDQVTVRYTRRSPQGERETHTEEFDALLIACPLGAALQFLDATDEERQLYSKIRFNQYCVTTAVTTGMSDHIVDVIPLTPFGHPWAMVKQWPDSNLCVYYTPVDDTVTDADVRAAIAEDVPRLGAQLHDFYIQHRWEYFPHVTPTQMADGFYDRLEALQGQRRTFLLGGALAFELVERAAAYSQAKVKQFFPVLAG